MTDNDQLKPLANLSPAELLAGLERTEPKERGDLFVRDGILYRRLNRHYQHLGNADLIRALVTREQAHKADVDALLCATADVLGAMLTGPYSEDPRYFGNEAKGIKSLKSVITEILEPLINLQLEIYKRGERETTP